MKKFLKLQKETKKPKFYRNRQRKGIFHNTIFQKFLKNKNNKIIIEYILLLNYHQYKLPKKRSDLTNWSYKVYEITEIVNDTIPSYKMNNSPERYNEALLKKTELTKKEKGSVLKISNLN